MAVDYWVAQVTPARKMEQFVVNDMSRNENYIDDELADLPTEEMVTGNYRSTNHSLLKSPNFSMSFSKMSNDMDRGKVSPHSYFTSVNLNAPKTININLE